MSNFMLGDRVKFITAKGRRELDHGIVGGFGEGRNGDIVYINNIDGNYVGYEKNCLHLMDKDTDFPEPKEDPADRKKRLKKEVREAKKQRKVANKEAAAVGSVRSSNPSNPWKPKVDKWVNLEKMQLSIGGTRNFDSGVHKIVWPDDDRSVTRVECTAMIKEFEVEEGMKLCVASWNKGETHFLLEVPTVPPSKQKKKSMNEGAIE